MKLKYIIRTLAEPPSGSDYDQTYYAGGQEGYGKSIWDEAGCAQRFNSEEDALMIAAHRIPDCWHPLEIKKIYEK